MKNKIFEIMKEVFEIDYVDENCSQENCDSWDSFHHLNLVVELESEFGISLEPEEIAMMRTFSDVEKVVLGKLGERE